MTDIIGTADADDLTGTSSNDSITGLGGNDLISGGGGANTLDGGAGDDIITAGTGFDPDTLIGGDGNDGLIASTSGSSSLEGGEGNDTLIGGLSSDTLNGGAGDDQILAAGRAFIDGGSGDDTLVAVDGSGTELTGGAGLDTFVINSSGIFTGIRITDFNAAEDTLNLASSPVIDLADLMARTTVSGTGVRVGLNGNSSITIENITPEEFFGANITFNSIPTPAVTSADIDGTLNAETLTGTDFGEVISGGDGGDSINGGSGNDTLRGDGGNDTLQGGSLSEFGVPGDLDNDLLEGGAGNDVLEANGGADTLNGGAGNDTINLSNSSFGSVIIVDDTSSDLIVGLGGGVTLDFTNTALGSRAAVIAAAREESGNTVVEFPNGNVLTLQGTNLSLLDNVLISAGFETAGQFIRNDESNDTGPDGDNGDEFFAGTVGDDTINTDFGDDTVNAGAGDDSVDGSSGNDSLRGEAGNDTLEGSVGNDSLSGGDGDDFIEGGSGDDTLNGDGGINVLTGGGSPGARDNAGEPDTFIIDVSGSTTVITDFNPDNDTVQFNLGGAVLLRLVVQQSNQGVNLRTNLRAEFNDGTTVIFQGLDDAEFFGAFGQFSREQVSLVFEGDFSDQVFSGSDQIDTLQGGGGDDVVTGGAGADVFIVPAPQPSGSLFAFNELRITDFNLQEDFLSFVNTGITTPDELANLLVDSSDVDATFDLGDGNRVILVGVSRQDALVNILSSSGSNFLFANPILGSSLADSLEGTSGSDLIDGGAGNDTIFGNLSSDTIQGGDDNDSLFGNGGADSIDGGSGNDFIEGGAESDNINGGDGNDTISGGDEPDSIEGGDDNDFIDGDGGADTIRGGLGSDTIRGGIGNDSIEGGTSNDLLEGGDGNDTLIGGIPLDGGGDTIRGGDGNDSISAGDRSSIEGGAGDDTITSSAEIDNDNLSDDTIDAGAGDDMVTSNAGNDSILAGTGSDTIIGGLGDDTIRAANGERDSLVGGSGNDVIELNILGNETFPDDFTLEGGAGDDMVDVMSAEDGLFRGDISGGQDDDAINVTFTESGEYEGDVSGGEGNDTINVVSAAGGSFRGTISGGEGDDVINVNTSTNNFTSFVDPGAGTNTVTFAAPSNDLSNQQGRLIIDTSAGAFTTTVNGFVVRDDPALINGSRIDFRGNAIQSFEDLMEATTEVDGNTVVTFSDNQTLILVGVSNADFFFDPGRFSYPEINEIEGTSGDDNIVGTSGNDGIITREGNDILFGDDGDDFLDGGEGDDTVDGGDGDDVISIGAGDNQLTGGRGIDEFNLASGANGTNVIIDFNVSDDSIGLTALDISDPAFLAALVEASAGNVLIQFDNSLLVLENIAPIDLSLSNFDFTPLILTSSELNTVLVGGGGNDVFNINDLTSQVFVRVDTLSSDTVAGFRTGVDTIDLQSSGFANAADLIAAISEDGANLVIDFGNSETLVLEGVSLSDILVNPQVVDGVVQADGLQNPGDFLFDDAAQIDGNLIGLLQADADPFNTPPEGMSEVLETDEDTPLVIQSGDFGFSDADGDMFVEVRIDAAPTGLTLGGVQVVGGQVIAVGALAGGNLVYTPPADESGDSFADITFSVNDGEDFDLVPNTFTIDVMPVNDAPEGGDITLDGTEDTALVISSDDFLFTDIDEGDVLAAIRIEETVIGLTLDGIAVEAGDVINVADIDLGLLAFTPATNANGNSITSFEFRVGDGAAFEATPSVATINIVPVNDAPVVEDVALTVGETGTTIIDIVDAGVDVDGDAVTLSLGGAGTIGTLEILDASTGVISFTSNADAVDLFEGETRTETISYTVDDGSGGTDTADLVITVEGEGTLTATPIAVVENDAGADVATLTTIADFPFVAGDVFTVDDDRFVVSDAGVVSLVEGAALDFETESEVDIVVTRVRGADGVTETLDITVSVTDAPAGSAQDGFISGALVFADANGNGVFDAGEVASTTDASGNFELAAGATGPVIIQGGINPLTSQQAVDISTDLDFNGTLSAPEGSTVVTPLTTLINEIAGDGADAAAIAAAETAVGNAFGIDPGIDLTTFDPIRAALAGDEDGLEVFAAGSQVLSTVVLASSVVEGASSDAGLDADGSAFGALADAISNAGGGAVDLTDNATVSDLVTNTATDADASAVVSNDVVTAATTTITGTNTAAQDAVADGGNTNVETLTEVTQAAVVAQGDAATAVEAAAGGDAGALNTAQTTFGTDLATTVTNAAVGTIVPDIVFTGTVADEAVIAGGGDDTLRGLGGDDTLTGGDGVDQFEIADNASDTITDFDAAGGEVIDLTDTDTLSLDATASGADTVITLGNGETLTLEGVAPGALGNDNFVFDTNALPTASGASLSGDPDDIFTITLANLGFADSDGDELASVTITSLPSSGTLTLAGTDLAAVPQAVTVAQIVGGQLVFTPTSGGTVNFGFTVNDGFADSAAATVSFAITTPSSGGSGSSGGSSGGSTGGGSSSDDNTDSSGSGSGSSGGSSSGGNSDDLVIVRDGNGEATVTGGDAAEVFTGDNEIEFVDLGGGNDRTDTGGGDDTVRGGDGNDTINGGDGADFLRGDDGDDSISGGDGNDRSFAGPGDTGDDTVEGNAGDDVIGAGAGDDLIVGGDIGTDVFGGNVNPAGNDTLFGGAGNDFIVAGAFNPGTNTVIDTGFGNNVIYSSTGNDTLFGDSLDDTLGGGDGSDSITGGDGGDILYGGIGSETDNADTLDGGAGDDQIFGAFDDDIITGGEGNDTVFGGAGNDTIDGGEGNDLIFGSAGDDTITGGEGNDTFAFITGFGSDTITDFGTADGDTDMLDFSEIEGLVLADLLAAATFADDNTTLTIGTHGTITLTGIDQTELQTIFDNEQILVG